MSITDEQRKYLTWGLYLLAALGLLIWLQPLVAERAPNQIIQRTISGLFLGGIYATIALGVVVVNKASGIFNLAHGAMMLIVGFVFFGFFSAPSHAISPIAAVALSTATVLMMVSAPGLEVLRQPRVIVTSILAIIGLSILMTIGGTTNAAIEDYEIEQDGTYSAIISSYDFEENGVEQAGRVSLRLTTRAEGQTEITAADTDSFSGSLGEEAQTAVFEFDLVAGDEISLQANSNEVDTTLTLLAPDGTEMVTNDDRSETYLFLSSISPGLYKELAGFDRILRWVHALVGALLGAIFIGLVIERFTIRPLIGQPIFAVIMVTLALAEILTGITQLLWGSQPKTLSIFAQEHPFIPGQYVRLDPITIETSGWLDGNILIDQPRLFAFVLSLVAFSGFFLLFRFTNIGLAMRATSEDQQLAESVGLRVRVILAVTWGIAAVLAGIAGVIYAGSTEASAIDANIAFLFLRALPAVLLGGLESVSGALLGGLILGLSEEWTRMLFSSDVAENLAPYLVLMIVLVIRPEGFFGEKRIERI